MSLCSWTPAAVAAGPVQLAAVPVAPVVPAPAPAALLRARVPAVRVAAPPAPAAPVAVSAKVCRLS